MLNGFYGFLLAIIGGSIFIGGVSVGLTVMFDGNDFWKESTKAYGVLIIVASIVICTAFVAGGYFMERSL